MTNFRVFFVLPLVVFLSSCNVLSKNMLETDSLTANEGILLIRTLGEGMDSGYIYVHDITAGGFQSSSVSISILPKLQVLLLKIDAGKKYRFTRYSTDGGRVEYDKNRYHFTIVPGKINYIGDIYVNQRRYSVRTSVTDEENDTVKMAKKQTPWLFNKYGYTKSLISPSSN